MHALVHLCIYQHTKLFEVPRFSDSKDMRAKFKKQVEWPWPHPLGLFCHPKASTWYILPAYRIWWLLLRPCGRQNWKCVMWPWPRFFRGGLLSIS